MRMKTLQWDHSQQLENARCAGGTYGPVRIYLVSSQPSIDIINRPECVGVEFQDKLSSALRYAVNALLRDTGTEGPLSQPLDVVYVLRGGLNFNLHQVLTGTTGRLPEVSFLSSQRVEEGTGFTIGENDYSKWSVQDGATLCIGDICATGTTMAHGLEMAITQYGRQKIAPQHVLVFSIGTRTVLDVLADLHDTLKKAWGPRFTGITLVYLEALFTLYCGHPALARTHLRNTDFFRKDAPRSLQLETDSLTHPVTLLERCAIYDGGSRSFEPRTYLANLRRYWERLSEEARTGIGVRDLLDLKTDALKYLLPYNNWRAETPWWSGEHQDNLHQLHNVGQAAVTELLRTDLKEICGRRLEENEAGINHNYKENIAS